MPRAKACKPAAQRLGEGRASALDTAAVPAAQVALNSDVTLKRGSFVCLQSYRYKADFKKAPKCAYAFIASFLNSKSML